MTTEKCPCNYCPYDCDDDEDTCARYLRWEKKNHDRQMSALTRRYNTALKRLEKQNSKLTELKKQLIRAIKILKRYHNECPSKYSLDDIDDMIEQFLEEVDK